jgi:phenylacetate-CoA ligase
MRTVLDEKLRWHVFFALDALRGAPVGRYYRNIQESYRKGTSVRETREKIHKLIVHAIRTTDFYRDYSEDTPLEQMPVMNKDLYRKYYEECQSKIYKNAPDNRTMYTSGSTGTPFAMIQNKDKIMHNTAASIFLGKAGGYEIGMKEAFIRMWVGDHAKKSRIAQIAENLIMMDCSNLDDEALGKMLTVIRKKRVKCLIGYSSALGELSRYIDQYKLDTSKFHVKAILPISESMSVEVRRKLEKQFRCSVRAWYSNEENGIMGLQKEENESYYIDSESYYYEILKLDRDEPAEPGELGRIVITDLYNYAFPLIRYDNGDLGVARRVEKKGRFKFYLDELYGRRGDMIYDCKGRIVSPFILLNGLAMEKEIRQFRFVQESISTYTLWLDADSSRVDEDRILNFIQPYFGEEAKITIEYKKDIPLLRSGKRKLFENRCERYGK